MDIALKIILLGKIKEFARKRVLEQEILKGAKKGLEKLEAALDNFWNDSIEFVCDRRIGTRNYRNLKKRN